MILSIFSFADWLFAYFLWRKVSSSPLLIFLNKIFFKFCAAPVVAAPQAFSSCGEGGLLSCCGARASHCFATPWTAAHQAPLSMKFSIQEYWSGLPFPSPADLPNLGMEPGSSTLQANSFTI